MLLVPLNRRTDVCEGAKEQRKKVDLAGGKDEDEWREEVLADTTSICRLPEDGDSGIGGLL
jgi:hypothetical protein